MRLISKGEPGHEIQLAVAQACRRAKGKKTADQIAKEVAIEGVTPAYVSRLWRLIYNRTRRAKPGSPLFKAKGKVKRLKRATAKQCELEEEFSKSKLCAEVDRLIAIASRGAWDSDRVMAKWGIIADSHTEASDEMKEMAKDKIEAFLQSN